ncbi:MAG: DUF11 domain-containing protein [Cocleimonas sp.]|nr:DUF11 domain-containing protein [Cocleimonas sp.]
MLIKILLIILLLIPFSFLNATSSLLEAIDIQLQQAVDTDCDGVKNTPYFQISPVSILPTECIIYKITAYNTSAKTLRKLVITGNIPPYTQLKKKSVSLHKGEKKYSENSFQYIDSAQINVRIPTLVPSESITLRYSVIVG